MVSVLNVIAIEEFKGYKRPALAEQEDERWEEPEDKKYKSLNFLGRQL
jgi:hypothetical protein